MSQITLNTQHTAPLLSSFYNESISLKKDHDIILAFEGVLDDHKVEEFASTVENEMKRSNVTKKYIKNYFSIVIEALQNIRIHSYKSVDSYCNHSFAIASLKDHQYYLETCNIIENRKIKKFREKIDKVLSLSTSELKSYYFSILSEGKISDKGGAGLGIITLALKSNEKLKYSIKEINDSISLLTIISKVNTYQSP